MLKRFKRYLAWLMSPNPRTFRFVDLASVNEALKYVGETLIGVHQLTKLMEPDMKLFSSLSYDVPHGM